MQTTISNKSGKNNRNMFNPYEGSILDTPLAHFVFEPFLARLYPFLRAVYPIRWYLSQPLQTRILPKCFPLIPGFNFLPYVTIGQILLTFPLVILFFAGYKETFLTPDLENSGKIASGALVFAYVTSFKGSSPISFFLGISFERMIVYHNLSSLLSVILGAFHLYVAYVYGDSGGADDRRRQLSSDDSQYGLYASNPNFAKFCFDGDTNLTGSMLLIFMLLLVGTSFFSILRRYLFEFWLFTHIFSVVAVVIFGILHGLSLMIFVGPWWGFDVVLRYIIMTKFRYPNKAKLTKLLPDLVEIRFEKTKEFQYNAGQFVQIAVPSISTVEFHPITISSAPHDSNVTLHVRVLGGWSQKLLELSQHQDEITILIEGPYGCLSVDLNNDTKYQTVLLVAGGIGVTPCQSLARSLLDDHKNGRKLREIRFVWAVRDKNISLAMPPPVYLNKEDEKNFPSTIIESSDSGKEDIEVRTTPIPDDDTSSLIQTEVYITSQSNTSFDKDVESQIFNGEFDAPFDCRIGRPDFEVIFQELKKEAAQHGETNVAVIGCGPLGMIDNLREACRKHSSSLPQKDNGVNFEMHEEIFNF